jgi:hypothetical protein
MLAFGLADASLRHRASHLVFVAPVGICSDPHSRQRREPFRGGSGRRVHAAHGFGNALGPDTNGAKKVTLARLRDRDESRLSRFRGSGV